jgi:tetratricopeptide (TPR) repeat protein
LNPGATVAFLAGTPHKWLGLQAKWRGEDPIPHFSRSIDAYKRALARRPDHEGALGRLADLLVLRAEVKLEAGQDPVADAEEAAQASRRCIELAPNLYLGHVNLGEALLVRARWETRQGRSPERALEQAEREIREALKTHPRDPEIHRDLAILARERLRWALRSKAAIERHLQDGLRHVQATLACNPGHGYVHVVKGQILLLAAQAGGTEADRRRLEAAQALARAAAVNANLRVEAERVARTRGL